jgi:hypothetical protein
MTSPSDPCYVSDPYRRISAEGQLKAAASGKYGLKVHHARKVEAWGASHAHEVELFYLPAYAPEHNPDEYLDHALEQALRQKPQPDSKDGLIRSARSVLRTIQRSPARVRAYFAAAPVRYAA